MLSPGDLDHEVVARTGDPLLPVHAEPLPGEQPLHLLGQQLAGSVK